MQNNAGEKNENGYAQEIHREETQVANKHLTYIKKYQLLGKLKLNIEILSYLNKNILKYQCW